MDLKKQISLGEMLGINTENIDMRALIHDGIVGSAVINKQKRELCADISMGELCNAKSLYSTENYIATKFGLSSVRLRPKYPDELLNNEYFKELSIRLLDEFPSICGYISGAQWQYAKGVLTIKLATNGAQFTVRIMD
ncbi:MAG: hypothetical protein RSA70_06970 [Clostridia bacterium]